MTFQEYLEQIYVENGHTDLDNLWDWISDLPVENIIYYAEKFGNDLRRGRIK